MLKTSNKCANWNKSRLFKDIFSENMSLCLKAILFGISMGESQKACQPKKNNNKKKLHNKNNSNYCTIKNYCIIIIIIQKIPLMQ